MKGGKNFLVQAAAWTARLLPPSIKKLLYCIPFLAKFIRKQLNAAVPEGQQVVDIAGGLLKGLRLSLDLRTEKDYWLGTYEVDLQNAARKFIQPGMVVYDVGANIGYISLLAARMAGKHGNVISIEALPANIERLRENIRLNNLQKRIEVVHAAVVDQSGETAFFTHKSGAMGKAAGSAGRETDYEETINVRAVALDDFIFNERNPVPAVIKMDIEGGEKLAVYGMGRVLKECRPTLLIELHGEGAARAVWKMLMKSKYSVHTMRRGHPRVRSLNELNWKAYIIAIPDSTSN